ncbi:di-heme oxidoredictase family protein [Bacterioplanoides sp.]|uniref:di-heme oxidoredictase family protein n=1 Tax=Bacterioplanoides sp. TaxID=2066072 RepID=UPI003B5AB89A
MKKIITIFAIVLLTACGGEQKSTGSNFAKPDPSQPRQWSPVAGQATVEFKEDLEFLQFIPGLDLSVLPQVAQGRELFVADWTMAPGSRELLDGLGPLFVSGACDNCHLVAGRAAALLPSGEIGAGLLFRLGNEAGVVDPHYGGQLQNRATVGNPEGTVTWQDTAGKPRFAITQAGKPLAPGINLGPRQSPQLTGVGLLELVPDEQILQRADPQDSDNNGISGKAHHLNREGKDCIGRFGWKAMHCTMRGQSAGALQQDMGLTTPLNPAEPCTASQSICDDQPSGGSPEVSEASLTAINEFLTLLAVPARRVTNQERFNQGADLFEQVGCDQCHRPTFVTGAHPKFSQLSNQTIYAYTDLLLHDMGDDLSDGVREGDAMANEWKTPPLWGIGIIEGRGQSSFLHDGRAKTIADAIRWHGGEAASSRSAYNNLSAEQQALLLGFLRAI